MENLGYTVTKDDDSSAYLIWNDTFSSVDRISDLKDFQRVNHFPGMAEICKKDSLARNMAKYALTHNPFVCNKQRHQFAYNYGR